MGISVILFYLMWSNLWVFFQRFRTQSLECPSSIYCLALYVSTYPTSYPCTRNRLHRHYRRHYHVSSCLLTGTFSVVLRFARVLIASTNIMEKIIIIIIIIIIFGSGNYFFIGMYPEGLWHLDRGFRGKGVSKLLKNKNKNSVN